MSAVRVGVLVVGWAAASAWLVGFCGVAGLLVWLGIHAVGLTVPDRVVTAVTSLRWRHVRAGWQWLDRR